MFQSKDNATLIGLVCYLGLVLAAPLGKLLGLGHLATLPWSHVTVLVWGPWVLGSVCWLLLGLVALGDKVAAKIKNHNDLTLPRS